MVMNADAEILVVDDDDLSRRMLVRTLGMSGYHCSEAASSKEAWQLLHEGEFGVVLLDLVMPDMDGAALLKKIRTDNNPNIAQAIVIMLTGHAGEESEVMSLESGANDFVTKPINSEILRARIETQLRLVSMRRLLEHQNEQLEAWRRDLERDLESARLTQRSLIPQKPLQIPGWEVAACFKPVIQVGGDIYGWLKMRDDRVLFWIADAVGHGASAALLTTLIKLLFHHASAEKETPVEIMGAVLNDFRDIFGTHLFMTAMCVALDPKTGRASVLGAGHPPLLILRKRGEPELIWSKAPPVGLAAHSQLAESTFDLEKGDSFILYTDGFFGSERSGSRPTPEALAARIEVLCPDVENLLKQLLPANTSPSTEQNLADDIAAIAVRRTR